MKHLRQWFNGFMNLGIRRWVTHSKLKPLRNLVLIVCLIIMVFLLVHWWQTKDALPASGHLRIPAFTLPDLDGEMISNIKDQGPALYYFFAPWCTVCDASIENLNVLNPMLKQQNIKLYIIALEWKDKNEVLDFVSHRQLPVKPLLGSREQLRQFKIKAFPTYYVTNSQNEIEWVNVGYSTELGIKIRSKWLTN
jgi:peroxiredoxin